MRTLLCALVASFVLSVTASATPLLDAAFRSFEVTLYPRAAAIGDFDEDGRNDIAVGSRSSRVTLLRGMGDGDYAFVDSLTVPFGYGLEAADLDGDGHLDLVVWGGEFTGDLSVIRGQGDLTFDPLVALAPGAVGRGLVVADLVGSPDLDIVVSDSVGVVGIRPGLGGMAFGASVRLPVSGTVFDLAAADLDSDGLADLIVNTYDGAGFEVEVHRNLGGGAFAPPVVPAGDFRYGLAVADLDSDGLLDVVVGGNWLRGIGGGALAPPVLFGDPFAVYPAVGDLDGDGVTDVLTNGDETAPGLSDMFQVHRGLGGGAFAPVKHVWTGNGPGKLYLGDLDGDPYPDALAICYGRGQVCVQRGLGRNGFAEPPRLAAGGEAVDVLIAESTDDALPDILAVSDGDARVRIYPGNGDFTFDAPIDLSTPASVRRVAVGDVNGDGVPDIVTANGTSISVFAGAGGGAFAPRVDHATSGTSLSDVAVGDVGADGYDDVLVVSPGLSVFPGGALGLGTRQDYTTAGDLVRTARLDGDAHPDVLVLSRGGLLSWRLGQPGGTLGAAGSLPRGEENGLAVLDLDADGDLDVVTTPAHTSTQLRVALGDGAGNLVDAPNQPGGRHFYAAEAADFDGDGVTDIVTANGLMGVAKVFRGLGGSTLGVESSYGAMGTVLDVSVGDLDGDGWTDVACALDENWSAGGSAGFVSVLRNTRGRLLAVDPELTTPRDEAGALWPNPVPAGGRLRLAFALPTRTDVGLDVFDVSGRRVVHEGLGSLAPGRHQHELTVGADWTPGLYWLRVSRGGTALHHRMVVTR